MRTDVTMVVVVAAAALLGCGSLTAKTAPHVGCKAYEITISDEARVGDAYTWTATCQGRWYRCSHVHRATECTDASSGSGSYSQRQPEVEAPKIAGTPPPTGAAGFELGAEIGVASRLCVDAGKAWKELPDNTYECGGPPADVGFAAVVQVEVCNGKVCGVQVVSGAGEDGAAKLVDQYTKLRNAFAQKYGAVYTTVSKGMGGACIGDELGACFADGRASASSTWRWRTGQTLELSLGKGAGANAPAAFRMIYRRPTPPSAGQPKLDNL
jgi:hypothetical protein